MKRWTAWISCFLIFALILGCSNAGSYIKDSYPLVDVQGKGKESAKIYSAEGKDVPTVANELANKEKPKEKSKDSKDRMFLVYPDKVINVQKDPVNENNTLIEINSIEYAKSHYDSSFLQGFITASILQSLFGGGWFNRSQPMDYRGYTSVPRNNGTPQAQAPISGKDTSPTTTDRSGSFNTKPSASTAPSNSDGAGKTPDSSVKSTTPSANSGSSGTFRSTPSTGSESNSATARKNDGSSPSYKTPSNPSTSARSGSFSKRK